MDVCFLFESLKVALNFSKHVSKSLSKGDQHFNKYANQERVVFNKKISINPTWARPFRYQ
jgi:hypothetical protein